MTTTDKIVCEKCREQFGSVNFINTDTDTHTLLCWECYDQMLAAIKFLRAMQ